MARTRGDAQCGPPLPSRRNGLETSVGWEPHTDSPKPDRSQVAVTLVADAPKRKRISRNTPPRCWGCGRELGANEPAWRSKRFLGKTKLGGWRYCLATQCAQCKSALRSFRPAVPCEGCGRTVHDEELRARTVCSSGCARKAGYADARQRRAECRGTVTCPCGERFAPKRKGARYCSVNCRVDSFRKRATGEARRLGLLADDDQAGGSL
jgi:hypothetical protein